MIIFVQSCIFDSDTFTNIDGIDYSYSFKDMQAPYKDTDVWKVLSCVSMFLVAFAFSINLFPIYSGLKEKSNENCHKTVSVSIWMIGGLYTFLSIPCLFLFGKRLDILNGNIMNNVNEEY